MATEATESAKSGKPASLAESLAQDIAVGLADVSDAAQLTNHELRKAQRAALAVLNRAQRGDRAALTRVNEVCLPLGLSQAPVRRLLRLAIRSLTDPERALDMMLMEALYLEARRVSWSRVEAALRLPEGVKKRLVELLPKLKPRARHHLAEFLEDLDTDIRLVPPVYESQLVNKVEEFAAGGWWPQFASTRENDEDPVRVVTLKGRGYWKTRAPRSERWRVRSGPPRRVVEEFAAIALDPTRKISDWPRIEYAMCMVCNNWLLDETMLYFYELLAARQEELIQVACARLDAADAAQEERKFGSDGDEPAKEEASRQ